MQAQLQALIGVAAEILRFNTRSNVKVAKLQMFNRKVGKVLGFLTAYRYFIRMRMRNQSVEEQILWVLLYV